MQTPPHDPSDTHAERIASLARALAHPARVRIVAYLLARPGCIGGDIVGEVGLAQSTVSEHLRILKEAGLVRGEIVRPHICYALDAAAIAPLTQLLAQIAGRAAGCDGAAGCYVPAAENNENGEHQSDVAF